MTGVQTCALRSEEHTSELQSHDNLVAVSLDRKSTRLNSSHTIISYAVFCLKKKKALAQTGLQIQADGRQLAVPPPMIEMVQRLGVLQDERVDPGLFFNEGATPKFFFFALNMSIQI